MENEEQKDQLNEEEHDYVTLVDENGAETLYEILLTVDGQKEFGKNYVLLFPTEVSDDEEVELYAYSYEEDDDEGLQGKLNQIETDEEWDMIEGVLNTYLAEEGE